jgi:hypothetical protein
MFCVDQSATFGLQSPAHPSLSAKEPPMTRALLLASLAVCLLAPSLHAGQVVGKLTQGDPQIKSIDTLAFATDGVLLISDGSNSRIIAVQTGDTQQPEGKGPIVKDIPHAIAAALGTADKNIEIAQLVVTPPPSACTC